MAALKRSTQRERLVTGLTFCLLIFAASMGPIYIRRTQNLGVPSLTILFFRQLIACTALAPIVIGRERAVFGRITAQQWLRIVAAGLFFTVNLVGLLFALEYGSVMVTTILRRTSVLWLAALEVTLLAAVFHRGLWLGLVATFCGAVLMVLGSGSAVEAGSRPLLGMGIAATGAFFTAFYLLLGRSLRNALPATSYSWLIFAVAGVVTFGVVLVTETPLLGFSAEAWRWLLITALVTQLMGHLAISFLLRQFMATQLDILVQSAIIISAVVAYFQFGEIPSTLQIMGGLAVVCGILLVQVRKKS